MISLEKFKKEIFLLPNLISLFRGVLGIVLAVLILTPEFSGNRMVLNWVIPIFVIAIVTDYLDGMLARKLGMESSLGKLLDPLMDKVLILGLLYALMKVHFIPAWCVLLIVFREMAVTFARIGWSLDGQVIAAEKFGKIKFVLQAVLVFLGLRYLAYGGMLNSTIHSGVIWITTLLTVLSGASLFWNQRRLFKTPIFARFVSAVGVGLFPLAPGTWGSLMAIIWLPFFGTTSMLSSLSLLFWILLGYWAVRRIDLSQSKDPGFVTVDEFCGMIVSFWGIPIHFVSLVTGFFLFRFFDIVKPFPVRRFEKLPGYWGILCDDLAAGVYVLLIMRFLFVS